MLLTPSATFGQAKQTKGTAGHSDAVTMLKQDMRKLWTDHVVWTRDYIIAATEKQPAAPAALNRLMKNQDDIGSAVAKYYGDAAGRQLTTLLKDHIAIAGDIVKAAMAGDKTGRKPPMIAGIRMQHRSRISSARRIPIGREQLCST
jgi:hypothetical protein